MSENNNYGLLRQGFRPKNLAKILSEDLSLYKEYFGNDIDRTSFNPLIKIDEVVGRQIERLWVEIGKLFDSHQIQFAEGRFLDDLAIMLGLERKSSQFATSRLTFYKTSPSIIIVPSGTIVDNKSDIFLKEFSVNDRTELPDIIIIERGTGTSDGITSHPSSDDIFNIETVEWISDNINGSNPYVGGGTDYSLTLSGGYVTAIDWSPGGDEPTAGNIYYVKIQNYKKYIDVTAVESGSEYNAQINEIFNLQVPITGIAKITNDSSILNGRGIETDLSLRQRLLNAMYLLGNDGQMQSFLSQLHRMQSSKVFTLQNTGHFRSIIYSAENDPTAVVEIYNESINETELRKCVGTFSTAIIPIIKGGAGGTDVFPSPYSQTKGESGSWQIDWVSGTEDGSSRYIETTDYVAYSDYDNEIDWSPGGAEPTTGKKYWVKIVKSVEIAETFPLAISGRIVLKQGYDLNTVNNELFISLNDYIKNLSPNTILYYNEIIRLINTNEGISYIDNLKFTIIMRLYKGPTGGLDNLLLNGSGYSDSSNSDVIWINDEKDQSGVSYTPVVDFVWNVFTTPGIRRINWSPAGIEPTTNQSYWLKAELKGDILTPNDVVIELSEVDFTL